MKGQQERRRSGKIRQIMRRKKRLETVAGINQIRRKAGWSRLVERWWCGEMAFNSSDFIRELRRRQRQ